MENKPRHWLERATRGEISGHIRKLKPLERRGLLEIFGDAADKRSRRMRLTPAGLALLIEAMPIWDQTQVDNERLIARPDPESLLGDLRSLSSL